nr:transglycosylase SLT domain-containing protein [Gammaproteobacteria bacterium]NIX00022.1 transglycosylase SLT domain-containing protein [Phycisphaerae bacterium]
SDDKESRFKVDFDNGNLTIELLDERDASPDELRKRGMNMLDDLLGEKAAEDQDPILNNQLPRDVTPQKMPADYTTTEPYISPEGKRYHKMLINIPFREDHLRIRAQRYVPIVQRLCQKYDIHPKLVMAMIHTESSFNPKAISTFRRSNGQIGHAYGLMQLVPYSGGREAYEFVGGRGEPSPGLLFDPESNIELGIAYLYKLKRHYFVTVNDDQNRRYLVTAGYNTGPHNVAVAFVGQRDVARAIPMVNRMQPDRVYYHLIYNLPYGETRDYLRKVTQRMSLY